MTASENYPRGEENNNAKLTRDQVRAIRNMLAVGYTIKSISDRYRVSTSAIGLIKRGKTWVHVK